MSKNENMYYGSGNDLPTELIYNRAKGQAALQHPTCGHRNAYIASEDKPHKMKEETFDFVMDCIYDTVYAMEKINDNGYIHRKVKELILEKTEISG